MEQSDVKFGVASVGAQCVYIVLMRAVH